MLDISVGAAFLAGLLSFVSPCVLPIVPPYLCYLAGVSVDELKGETATAATSRRIIFSSIAFVLGFATVFVARTFWVTVQLHFVWVLNTWP